jgi:MFS transporter
VEKMAAFPGEKTLYRFHIFNALSFWIILGTPIVLFTTWLGGGSVAVGIVSSIMPFLTILQIPSTKIISHWGYRRIMLYGWVCRTLMLIGFIIIPIFKGTLSSNYLVAGVVFFLFSWSFIRGLANASWMPWMKTLIPEKSLGQYFARQNIYIRLMYLVVLFMSGVILGKNPTSFRFSFIFAFSFITAIISIRYLSRIPPVDIPEKEKEQKSLIQKVRKALENSNFRRFLSFAFFWTMANAGFEAFCVLFLKKEIGMSHRGILWLGASSITGRILILLIAGKFLDKWGSRPIMKICLSLSFLHLGGWFLLSRGNLPPYISLLILLYMLHGIVHSTLWIANTRLIILTVPQGSSIIAMAVYTSVIGVVGGTVPIIWGKLLSSLQNGFMEPFSYFFIFGILMNLASLLMLGRVKEKRAEKTSNVVLALLTMQLNTIAHIMAYIPRSTHIQQGRDHSDPDS